MAAYAGETGPQQRNRVLRLLQERGPMDAADIYSALKSEGYLGGRGTGLEGFMRHLEDLEQDGAVVQGVDRRWEAT